MKCEGKKILVAKLSSPYIIRRVVLWGKSDCIIEGKNKKIDS